MRNLLKPSKAQVKELVIVCLSLGPLTIKDEDKQLNSTYSFPDIFGVEVEQLYLESEKNRSSGGANHWVRSYFSKGKKKKKKKYHHVKFDKLFFNFISNSIKLK